MLKTRAENVIRKKFTDEIERLENELFEMKERQLLTVRNHFMRSANDGENGLQATVFKVWYAETQARLRDGDTAAEVKKLEEMLAQNKSDQAAKTKATLTRMCGARDATLVSMVFQAFVQFHHEYLKDKEYEDQVKKTEKAVKEKMAAHKDKQKSVLSRMNTESDTGLLHMAMSSWVKLYEEIVQMRKLENAMGGAEGKFNSLKSRQLSSAHGVQGRVNEQMKTNLLVRVLGCWMMDAKVAAIERHYVVKLDSKRRQLQGVQTLFKSFSQQLEAGLTNVGDGDSSGRISMKSHSRKMARGQEGTVSLPSIHARPGVA
jgi:hypothetical protein